MSKRLCLLETNTSRAILPPFTFRHHVVVEKTTSTSRVHLIHIEIMF